MLPLAERMRPKTLNEYIGQKHLVGEGAILRQMIERGSLSSFILWGPPGVGKTTLAKLVANHLKRPFYTLSAVTSGVKDVLNVGTTYTLAFKERGAADSAGVSGSAILTTCKISAIRGNLVTGSFVFQGTGALA